MTKQLDPLSAQGAWRETGRLLGWESLADAISEPRPPTAGRVTAAAIQRWCREDNVPPLWAIEVGDRMLLAEGHPPLNLLALRARIGEASTDPRQRLAEAEHELRITMRLIEAAHEDPAFHDIVSASNRLLGLLHNLIGHVCRQEERNEQIRRRRGFQPRDDQAPPALREIAGGRDQ